MLQRIERRPAAGCPGSILHDEGERALDAQDGKSRGPRSSSPGWRHRERAQTDPNRFHRFRESAAVGPDWPVLAAHRNKRSDRRTVRGLSRDIRF